MCLHVVIVPLFFLRNILHNRQGEVKLTDFGIAKVWWLKTLKMEEDVQNPKIDGFAPWFLSFLGGKTDHLSGDFCWRCVKCICFPAKLKRMFDRVAHLTLTFFRPVFINPIECLSGLSGLLFEHDSTDNSEIRPSPPGMYLDVYQYRYWWIVRQPKLHVNQLSS